MPEDSDKSNILIVDDLPEKVLVYRSILEDLGQNLVFARSGDEALREVLRQEFAVILLDVNMPGMNGFETAALIRRRKKSALTPIIFITAHGSAELRTLALSEGAAEFFAKPFDNTVLLSVVHAALHGHTYDRANTWPVKRAHGEEHCLPPAGLGRLYVLGHGR